MFMSRADGHRIEKCHTHHHAFWQIGDILFIKGAKYRPHGKPLIHKSPDISYRPDGSVITRLCLKVDAVTLDVDDWDTIS